MRLKKAYFDFPIESHSFQFLSIYIYMLAVISVLLALNAVYHSALMFITHGKYIIRVFYTESEMALSVEKTAILIGVYL